MHELEYYRRDLSRDAINALPIAAYEGPVLLVDDGEDPKEALDLLRGEPVIGFDTEARPCFEKGRAARTSLVQLAGAEVVVLVRLLKTSPTESLVALLEDPAVIKVGVGIREDMRLLGKKDAFRPAGLFDLGDAARALGLKTQGLRTLAANLMDVRISKGAQCSNWEKPELSPAQIRYAATDAWIGRELFFRLQELETTARSARRRRMPTAVAM